MSCKVKLYGFIIWFLDCQHPELDSEKWPDIWLEPDIRYIPSIGTLSWSVQKWLNRSMPFGTWTPVGPRNHVLDISEHWRHLANMIESTMCVGDAAFCQISLDTCCSLCMHIFYSAFWNFKPYKCVGHFVRGLIFESSGDNVKIILWKWQYDEIFKMKLWKCQSVGHAKAFRLVS